MEFKKLNDIGAIMFGGVAISALLLTGYMWICSKSWIPFVVYGGACAVTSLILSATNSTTWSDD